MSEKNIENSVRLSIVLLLLMLFTFTVSAGDIRQDECSSGEASFGSSLWTGDMSDKSETPDSGADEEPVPDAYSSRDRPIAGQSVDTHGAGKSGHFFQWMADQSVHPVCARSKTVRVAILEKLNVKDCSEVTALDLRGIRRLDIDDVFDSLKYGDFSGLTSLEYLLMRGVTDLPDGMFSDLTSLRVFSRSNFTIDKLSR